GVYLSGGNTRRLKGALAPLLRGGPLGKDAVSRLVGRLAADFETWRQRPLGTEDIRYLFGDGWYPCVRIGKRRERVPILVTLGVRAGAGAGGDRRGLPADDLRGDARGGREGARRLHEEVAPALRAGGREPRGGGGRALHLPALPGRAVEGAADDQRARAHQRGVSPPHEDAGAAAE